MDDLITDFLTETNESLADLDVALLTLERTPDDAATLSLIFRMVHTIKGTCGFLGLPRLERVAHAGENVLGKLRDGALSASPDLVSQVLAALDRIKAIVAGIAATGSEPVGDDTALISALNALASGEAPAPAPASSPPSSPAAAPPPVAEASPAWMPETAVAPAEHEMPPPAARETMRAPHAPTPVDPASAADAATGGDSDARALAGAAPAAAQTIRVTVDVLENLMTLVSELVLTRNQLLQLARAREDSGFTAPLQRLSHITSDLQEGVMKTRMQPIGNAWNKLPRLVRDLARDLGKKIELTMLGAETELDRQVLELIKDPLTHMIRNSGDHGLETPADRRAAGKPETGRITLNAFHEGGHILIEVADDGRGLAPDRIRAKVLANGLATESELAAMSEAQIQRFIFRAGFSTAAAVTAVSGRGVGMDVVKTNIEKIGGTIDLKSTPGQGTTFTIKIPLTLAIVSALIVETAGERFAIPQLSVVELVHARRKGDNRPGGEGTANEGMGRDGGRDGARDGTRDGTAGPGGDTPGGNTIERINDTPVLRLRDRLLPLVGLGDLLGLPPTLAGDNGAHIVVTQVGAAILGIIVDRVFDTEEIVVKPVAPILRHITMFSGNTILGDGSVIMILDPAGIARATGVGGGVDNKTAKAEAVENRGSAERMALLLFRAGGARMAVPLSLVARLENIPRDRIEISAGAPVTQYRGRLMPLVSVSPQSTPPSPSGGAEGGTDGDGTPPSQALLVFADGERAMGLMVDEIIDVVEDRLDIELASAIEGCLGTAVIGGQATDVLDTGHWLTRAWRDWFSGAADPARSAGRHVLVVEDSAFFRNLLVPSLSAAGFRVSTAANAAEALRLRDAGRMFDAVVSDIEMPDMDGLGFARAVRSAGPWSELPLIALSGRTDPRDVEAGRDAGFTDYVAKTQRDRIVESLRQCLADPIA